MSSTGGALTIRSVSIIVAAVVGVVVLGWLTGQWLPLSWQRSGDEQQSAEKAVELPLAAQVTAVESGASGTIHVATQSIDGSELAQLASLPALQVLLLDHEDNAIGDSDCVALATRQSLVHLRIRGGSIGDEGLAHLAKLPNLRILNLPHSRVTDRGLASLASAPRLSQLRLGRAQITDKGLAHLADFPALRQIHLIDAPITDAGLKTIAALADLDSLYLDGSRVTDAGEAWLLRARPDLHVHYNQQHHDRDPKRGHE